MGPIDTRPSRAASCTCNASGEGEPKAHKRRGVFANILRGAATVASVIAPGAAPVLAAVNAAIGKKARNLDTQEFLNGESETVRYLQIQREIERETRMYEATSNILKARHDATMSSIRNLKS